MRFSSLVDRIAGAGVAAWDIHYAALAAAQQGRDVIVLSIGDPDFDTPQAITEAAITALRAGDTHYTHVAGRMTTRQAVAAHHTRVTGQHVEASNVAIASGAQNGLFTAALCILESGCEVIALEPMYVTYEATLGAAGAVVVPVSMPSERDFHLDVARLQAAVTPRTRAIFYATPNNPTGVVLSLAELQAIADVARKHDLWVVADEVYAALTFETPHTSIASLPGMGERTLTVGSLSKSHAMTGWRAGWLVGPEPLIAHAANLALAMHYGLPGFVQESLRVAVTDAVDESRRFADILRRRRDLCVALLDDIPGVVARLPEAGMFMLLDVRGLGVSSSEFAWGLFRATGVSLLDAEAFGPSAAGHLRMAFAVDDARLAEACRRIRAYCTGPRS